MIESSRFDPSMREAGFTLFEMIIVLAVLGLALGLVLARGPMTSPRLDARAAAQDLASTLRLARSRAIAENRAVSVTVAPHAYRMDGEAARLLAQDVTLSGEPVFRFAPDGSATTGQVFIRGGETEIGLSVDWLTGRVHTTDERSGEL